MDFVKNLTGEINETMVTDEDKYTVEQMATAIFHAAEKTVTDAANGATFTDTRDRQQLGLLLLALQWNVNPQIRQAVRR